MLGDGVAVERLELGLVRPHVELAVLDRGVAVGLRAEIAAIFLDQLYGYQEAWFAALSFRTRMILKSRQIGATYYFAFEALIDAIETGRKPPWRLSDVEADSRHAPHGALRGARRVGRRDRGDRGAVVVGAGVQLRRCGVGHFRNLFIHAPAGKEHGIRVVPIAEVGAKDEFLGIKTATQADVLAAHRVPPQLFGIVPAQGSAFGNPTDATSMFFELEIQPLQAVFADVNAALGIEAFRFRERIAPAKGK
nr:terminase family protein [Sphingomonas ginsenosidivorax]